MTQTYKTITIQTFRDPEGKPTCRSNEGTCKLLKTAKWGTVAICGWDQYEILQYTEGFQFLKPNDSCPLIK